MKTVLTYGTFDLFHVGHVNLLRRLHELGDRLIVGLSTDEFNTQKGKTVVIPYAQRKTILESCRYVDGVLPEKNWQQKRQDIQDQQADIFAMGDDWIGKFDDLVDLCEVVYLPRTKDISTTEVKQLVKSLHEDKMAEIKAHVQFLANLVDI